MSEKNDINDIVNKYSESKTQRKDREKQEKKEVRRAKSKSKSKGKTKKMGCLKYLLIALIVGTLIGGAVYIGGNAVLNNLFKQMGMNTDEVTGEDGQEILPTDIDMEATEKKIMDSDAEKIARDAVLNLLGIDITDAVGTIKYIDTINSQSYFEINFVQDITKIKIRIRRFDGRMIHLQQETQVVGTSVLGRETCVKKAEEFIRKQYPLVYDNIELVDKTTFKDDQGVVQHYKYSFNEKKEGKKNNEVNIYVNVNAYDGFIEYYKEIVFL